MEMNPTSIHEDAESIPVLVQWVGIRHCCELWYRSQMWLRSCVAMAVSKPAAPAPIRQTPNLGTYICRNASGMALKCKKKKKKKKKKKEKK